MPKSRAIARAERHPPRLRSVITTIMLVLISVMIVRDIFVRRWGSTPRAPDVTERLR
jgi:hypothetical protein